MAFPSVPRFTRSQSSVKSSKLNVSYDVIVHNEQNKPGKSSDFGKIPSDDILTDLRNKLSASYARNKELELENMQLKNESP